MPWNTRFRQDTNNPAIGTMTTVYENDASEILVSHSSRVDTRVSAEKINFAAAAQKLLDDKIAADAFVAQVVTEMDAILAVKQSPVLIAPPADPVVEPTVATTPTVPPTNVRP